MSKDKSQQFVLITKDDSRETREKVQLIRILMRKMAFDNGQKLEERCITVEEYEKELKEEENKRKQKEEDRSNDN